MFKTLLFSVIRAGLITCLFVILDNHLGLETLSLDYFLILILVIVLCVISYIEGNTDNGL